MARNFGMQNKQTNPQKLRIFKNVITVFFLPAGSYIFHGLLYSQKKIIMAMDFSQRLLQESLRTNLKIHPSFLPFYQFSPAVACSSRVWRMRKRKAGERGGGAGKKEKRSFLLVFFLFALSQILRTRLSRSWFSGVCACPRKGGMSAKEFNE